MDDFAETIRTVGKLKLKMMERGLKRARTTCPRCKEPNLWGVLASRGAGRTPHIHVQCQTPGCSVVVME